MLKKYPTVRYILQRSIWYFITFLVALSLNFFLPRLGSDPVDIMMAQSSYSSPEIRKRTEVSKNQMAYSLNLRKAIGIRSLSPLSSLCCSAMVWTGMLCTMRL